MANKTMHHVVIGSNTYEIVDEQGRANVATNTQQIATNTQKIATNKNDITTLKEDLSDNFGLEKINNFIPSKYLNVNVSIGATVDLTEKSSNAYTYVVFDCKPNDKVMITGRGGNASRLWAFIDSSDKLLAKSEAALHGEGLIVTAPANTARCIINSEKAMLGNCYITPDWFNTVKSIVSNTYNVLSEAIPSAADFNDYTTPGNYYVSTTAIANSLINKPTGVGGRLLVMTINSSLNIFQIYVSTEGKVFTREKDNSGWSKWSFRTDSINLKFEDSNSIPSGADLNDYTTAGNFYVSTTAIARSLVHAPRYMDGNYVNSSGRLIVMTINSGLNIFQTYITVYGEIFTRERDSKYWTFWEKKASEADTARYAARASYNALQAIISQSEYNITFANAYTPMTLKNYLGNTQNVHPKVLYFENGFGGHKYWMAYTPYPHSEDIYENPCVAFSDDGFVWKNISSNPLDEAAGNNYNSDTHLVYRSDTGVLECWYRYYERDTEIKTIYRRTSTDGVTWTERETIKTFSATEDCASPAILWDGAQYLVWGVSAGTAIDFYTISPSNMSEWTLVRTLSTQYYDNGIRVYPWHIDVIKDGNTYILLAMTRNSRQVSDGVWSLFIATSTDNIDYGTPVKVVGGADGWDKYMYRSSIVKVGTKYRIYYSACSSQSNTSIYNSAHWGIGITESDTLLAGYIGKYE